MKSHHWIPASVLILAATPAFAAGPVSQGCARQRPEATRPLNGANTAQISTRWLPSSSIAVSAPDVPETSDFDRFVAPLFVAESRRDCWKCGKSSLVIALAATEIIEADRDRPPVGPVDEGEDEEDEFLY